jgi:hypothetical protein
MPFRTRIAVITALVASVVTIGVWASAQISQVPRTSSDGLELVAPMLVAGSDLGFRIEGYRDNIPFGKVVIRIDGRWIEAQLGGGGVLPAAAR